MNINELTPLQENNISFLFLFYRSVGFVSVILSYQQRGNKLSCKSFCPHLEHIKTMPFFSSFSRLLSPICLSAHPPLHFK
ncbi:rCG25691 [Rattus norvegicus]|uniref:RCG25691 n=1 Tax=Rattus norvegicus TaxID=10116 RepID=A6I2E7_RAT|nr:rCG25691 [Rattus norvegicus]